MSVPWGVNKWSRKERVKSELTRLAMLQIYKYAPRSKRDAMEPPQIPRTDPIVLELYGWVNRAFRGGFDDRED